MAVQQNKKSPSKRGMHRAHDFRLLRQPPLNQQRVKIICVITSARPVSTVAKK